jgi:catechol 2,3-dioxygenase
MNGPASETPTPQASIPAATTVGPVRLRVDDLDRLTAFYRDAIGLSEVAADGSLVRLGVRSGEPLVELIGAPGAPRASARSSGLFHLAVLVPDRPELARAVRRVIDSGWSFTGASDHLVSEAMYLDDPEGNGIEIYRDRPRPDWPRLDGTIQMATEPLDLDGVMAEEPAGSRSPMPEATTIGHVHLSVADLEAAERFHHELVGFDVTVRGYPGALFLSAGGYHHHLGLNTWRSSGVPAPPPGALGLDRFQVTVPDAGSLRAIGERLDAAGVDATPHDGGLLVTDPSGIRVLLAAA